MLSNLKLLALILDMNSVLLIAQTTQGFKSLATNNSHPISKGFIEYQSE